MGCKLPADLNHLRVMTHTKVGWVPCWGLGCKVPLNMDKHRGWHYIKLIPLPLPLCLPMSLLPHSKLVKILHEVKQVLSKTNKNYGLLIKGMYKYYDMKLVSFGIDQDRNLIIKFPVFVQPYTQKPQALY